MSSDWERIWARTTRYAAECVDPRSAALDARADPAACFDWELVEEGSRLGLRTLTLSPGGGGAGLGLAPLGEVIFELARHDVGVAAIFAQTNMLWRLLDRSMHPAQRKWVLPRFRDDPRCVLAVGITEPEVGSDHVLADPSLDPPARFATVARRVQDGWEISGRKIFIDNGNRAGIYVVLAQTDPDRGLAGGASAFVVPAGTPGLSWGAVFDKMGERLANHAEVVLARCHVADDALLGDLGGGPALLGRHFAGRTALAGLEALGVAEAAYDAALAWARSRVQGGRPIVEHDIVGAQIAEWRMRIDAAHALLVRTLTRIDTAAAEAHEEPLAKVLAAEVAVAVATGAMELHGGRGYMRGNGMEKLVRDALSFLHSDGANRTLLIRAARSLRAAGGTATKRSNQRSDQREGAWA